MTRVSESDREFPRVFNSFRECPRISESFQQLPSRRVSVVSTEGESQKHGGGFTGHACRRRLNTVSVFFDVM
jgi:hypothetical protein